MIHKNGFIKKVKKGDRKAQKALYDHFAPKMLALCYRYCDCPEDAEDVLQDAFIRVFKYLPTFREDAPLECWIRRVVVNTALNHLRKNAASRFLADIDELPPNEQPAVAAKYTLHLEELLDLIKSLPTGYRTVFNLHEIEGYTHAEIAEILDISANTSKSQLAKARVLMQKKINELEKL